MHVRFNSDVRAKLRGKRLIAEERRAHDDAIQGRRRLLEVLEGDERLIDGGRGHPENY